MQQQLTNIPCIGHPSFNHFMYIILQQQKSRRSNTTHFSKQQETIVKFKQDKLPRSTTRTEDAAIRGHSEDRQEFQRTEPTLNSTVLPSSPVLFATVYTSLVLALLHDSLFISFLHPSQVL